MRAPLARRRPRFLRPGWLVLGGLLLLLVGFVALEWSTRRLLRRAGEAALAGRRDEARALFEKASGRPWHRGAGLEGLAVVELLDGRIAEGRQGLGAARQAGAGRSPFDTTLLFSHWVEQGSYEPMESYAAHLSKRQPDVAEHRLWLGLALNGLGRLDEARVLLAEGLLAGAAETVARGREAFLGPPFRTPELREAYRRHLKSLDLARRSGRRSFLFDRSGRSLAHHRSEAGWAEPELEEAARLPLLGARGEGGLLAVLEPRDSLNEVHTTLDLRLQRLAGRVVKGHDAALVVLDVEGRVLAAAAGVPRRRDVSRPPLDPLAEPVPLASVTKIATLAAALRTPEAIEAVLPFQCKGPLRLEEGLFYDWLAHGSVPDARQALGVSCNLVFARLGLETGRGPLLDTLAALGLGREADAAGSPVRFGDLTEVPPGERALARFAAGDAGPEVPLVHAAALALAVGREGDFRHPYLIAMRRAVGGHVYGSTEPWGWRALPEGVARQVARGMRAAVELADGTAARLALPGLPVAAKTGTWGNPRRGGQSGLVVGFAPAAAPEHAFAVCVRGEGKASGAAARLSRELLEALAGRN